MRPILCSLALLFVSVPAAGQAQESKYLADTVSVQADASYEADPDLATLNFQVSVTDKQLTKAYELATASLQRILQLAERTGVPRQDITTGTFTVDPDYDWRDRKRRPRAYRVESSVMIRLRDFARIGALIDEAVESGIADFRSLTYSLQDEENAKVRAVALARERAEARARAALGNGSRLGPLRHVTVDVQTVQSVVRLQPQARYLSHLMVGALAESKEAEAPPPPVPPALPEKMRVRATVHCVFEIAEAK